MYFDNIFVNGFQNGIAQTAFSDGYILGIGGISTKSTADAGLYLFNTYAVAQNIKTAQSRTGIRMVSTTLTADMYFVANPGQGLHTIRCHSAEGNSSLLMLDQFQNDNEAWNGTGSTIAVIDMDNGPSNLVTGVRIQNPIFSSSVYPAPYVKLRNIYPGGMSTFFIRGAAASGHNCPLVQQVGGTTGWNGSIEDVNWNNPNPDFDSAPTLDCTFGARTSRIKFEPRLTGLPIAGPWPAGATTVHVLAEALVPGMPTKFVCVRGGQYGTANPPVWDGREIYSPDGSSNAVWMTTTRTNYASCSISGL